MPFKALLAALAAFSAAASAQAPSEFSAEAFRAHVTFLADDLLEGRDTGSRGYDIAARYVAAQFAALGLRPAGADGSWYQPVAFVRYTLAGTPTLTIGGRTLAHGREMVMRASPDASALALEASLVFAGYGLDLPARGFDDYRGLDVRGKIVVLLDGTPSGIASDVAAHLSGEKRRAAAARGAVGLIVIRTRASAARTPWERLTRAADRPGMTWLERDGRPHIDGEGLRFSASVDEASAEALFRGARRSWRQVMDEAARAGARPRGFPLVATARAMREPAAATRLSSSNVVAILPGTDPALAGEYVLLMAHLDHHGVRATEEGDRINNGAMDNATGVATLIEVARVMSQTGNRPRRPVLIAAVTAEERGLLGAEYLARHPVVDGRIVGLVNLDMPILTYDFQDVAAFGAEHSTLGPIVARAAARMGIRVSPDPLPEEGLFTRSDHYKFVREGVPAVFLMTGFANGGEREFRRFLDTRYHRPNDDLSQALDWQAGAKFARLNYLIAREIADGDSPPLWYVDSFFGTAFGGGQRRAERPPNGGSPPASASSE